MKVLQISKFYPPVKGGIEAVAWELTEGLNAAGIATDVLCAHQQLQGACERTAAGYQVQRSGSLGLWMSTSMAPALLWHLRRMAQGKDLIHLHMPDPAAALACWFVRPRAPLVVHWHSDVVRQRRAMRLYAPLQEWVLSRAAAVVATSQAYADSSPALQRWRSKVEIIPIGVRDHAALVDPVRVAAIQAANGPGPLVFALGRMTYYKGFDVLIRAAASLPPQVRVVIGGDGEMLEPLRALVASSGLAGRLQLPGAIADEDVYNWFAACDVFCMPSTLRAEAYGVAMLEAMVMGKPVLAGNIEGSAVPWVNQHGVTGFNVPVGDAAALARSLHELLAQPDLRSRLGRAARQRYEQGLTGRLMTERTIALYRRLLGADATQQNRQGSSIS